MKFRARLQPAAHESTGTRMNGMMNGMMGGMWLWMIGGALILVALILVAFRVLTRK